MSNVYDLAQLRADMDKQFAPVKMTVQDEELTLRNLMRVNEKDREKAFKALTTIQDHYKDEDEEKEPTAEELTALSGAVADVLRVVTADGKGDLLVSDLDGDLALSMEVIRLWTEATQPGEASNSPG